MISLLKRKLSTFYRTKLTGSKIILAINYNLHAIMTSNDNRIKYIKNTGYRIRYGKNFIVFPTTECATYLYWNGVCNRGLSIGRSYFLDSIIFKDGDIVIDCGANLGDLKLYFDNIKVNVEYIAFEPNPNICTYLQKNIFPSNHYQIALWNESATKEFFVSHHTADSSLIRHPFTNQILKVQAKRLDELEFRKIKLFKVEAEGAEPEVLIGAEKILKNIEFISADLGPERGMDQKNTIPAVTNYLLSRNFELVYAIAPSNRRTFLFKNLASHMN